MTCKCKVYTKAFIKISDSKLLPPIKTANSKPTILILTILKAQFYKTILQFGRLQKNHFAFH